MNRRPKAATSEGPVSSGRSTVRLICNAAYGAAGGVAAQLARWKGLPQVQGLRSNLKVAYALAEDSPALDVKVAESLKNLLISYVDLFVYLLSDPAWLEAAAVIDPVALAAIEDCRAQGRGVLIVGPHLSSFEVVMLAFSRHLRGIQALTKPNPGLNSRLMNWLRSRFGLRVTPVSAGSLREAIQRLRGGGIVVTAADVPEPGGTSLRFFGRSGAFPIGHARLALAAGASIMVAGSRRIGPEQFQGFGTMCGLRRPTGDATQDAREWAQAVLSSLEGYVADNPHEWFMPCALWPRSEAQAVSTGRWLPRFC